MKVCSCSTSDGLDVSCQCSAAHTKASKRIFSLVNSQASADTDTELSIQASVVGVIRARAAEAAKQEKTTEDTDKREIVREGHTAKLNSAKSTAAAVAAALGALENDVCRNSSQHAPTTKLTS